MADAVIIETTRGGKDVDRFYHIVTTELADQLDNDDPWKDLGPLEMRDDPRILKGYLGSESEARQWCAGHGHTPEDDLFEAVGY